MATYIIRPRKQSPEGFKIWVAMGYLGSYEQYKMATSENEQGLIFINGDLGPHCTECSAPCHNLCDYPVGDDLTCDRALCDDHSHGVANDTHYCRDHFIMWSEYLASNRGYDVLANITPLGLVKKDQPHD